MTESGDNKNWNTKQNWIKDVLSKSGTELMEITTTSTKNGIVKKYIKKVAKESPNKMVYYQSMPLIVKSEPTSETQFCTPLGDGPTTTNLAQLQTQQQQQQQQQLQHQNVAHNYSIHSSKQLSTMVMQQQQQQQQTSINNSNDNTSYLTTNIKTELLPPGLTVYAASTSAAANNSNHSSTSATTPAITTINVSNNAPLTTATVTAIAARKSATIKPQFKCDQCGMTFGSKSAHTSHTKSHAKTVTNSNDELVFLSGGGGVSQLQQQFLDISTDETQLPLIKAPLINKSNAATSAAIVASAGISNSAGGGDPYQCNVCQKTFAVPARLIRHYRTHTGERPFECEFCHKLFSVKENLQVHRRIHTKERPYKCDVCGRAFEHSGKLHRHMRIHTGERPHKCSVCGKTFIQSGQLVIHMRTHTGEKPYKCPVEGCGKGFTCSKQLKVHSRTHTGEKPYHCDICFRDFGYNHVLKLHRVQHYGSKCYKCTICDETFKNKKEMEAHIKGHANELPDDEAGGGDDSGASNSGQGSSNSSSLGDTTNSAPSSPQSPTSSLAAAVVATATQTISRNAPKPKKSNAVKHMATISLSPSSPGSTSSAGNTRLSTASPNTLITSASASPALSLTHETEQQQIQQQIYTLYNDNNGRHNAAVLVSSDELPTDLRVLQQQQQPSLGYTSYSNNSNENVSNMYQQQRVATSYTYVLHSPPPLAQILPKQQQSQQQQQLHRPVTSHELTTTSAMGTAACPAPTINPALLEAASIAKRISHVSLVAEEEEDAETQAALQIMQLNRAQQQTQMQHKQKRHQHKQLVVSELPYNDDTHEANELIEHYKRGELARHGLHKRYAAPVPKFESSLLHNEIVRQVEAAIAPLRSSTESPERSSSPESDSMMMADRDVMTLPLRKRKLYMNKDQSTTGSNGANGLVTEAAKNAAVMNNSTGGAATNAANAHGNNNELGNKVLRMSSVIQFAKAS